MKLTALVLGAVLGVSSLALYAAAGYGRGVVLLWLAALVVLAAAFWAASERLPRVEAADLLAAAGLVVAFAPLYLARIYSWPAQVNSDEVAIMTYAEELRGPRRRRPVRGQRLPRAPVGAAGADRERG